MSKDENTEKAAQKEKAPAQPSKGSSGDGSASKPRYIPVPFHLRERPETPEKE